MSYISYRIPYNSIPYHAYFTAPLNVKHCTADLYHAHVLDKTQNVSNSCSIPTDNLYYWNFFKEVKENYVTLTKDADALKDQILPVFVSVQQRIQLLETNLEQYSAKFSWDDQFYQ